MPKNKAKGRRRAGGQARGAEKGEQRQIRAAVARQYETVNSIVSCVVIRDAASVRLFRDEWEACGHDILRWPARWRASRDGVTELCLGERATFAVSRPTRATARSLHATAANAATAARPARPRTGPRATRRRARRATSTWRAPRPKVFVNTSSLTTGTAPPAARPPHHLKSPPRRRRAAAPRTTV